MAVKRSKVRKKSGRPRVPDHMRMCERITVYVTTRELSQIDVTAEMAGETRNMWLRGLIEDHMGWR